MAILPETLNKVKLLAGYGLPKSHIAAICNVPYSALVKTDGPYSQAILEGEAVTHSKVASALLSKALNGDTTALIWWTKARMGWSEKKEVDITQRTMVSLQLTETELNKLSTAELDQIESTLKKLAAPADIEDGEIVNA